MDTTINVIIGALGGALICTIIGLFASHIAKIVTAPKKSEPAKRTKSENHDTKRFRDTPSSFVFKPANNMWTTVEVETTYKPETSCTEAESSNCESTESDTDSLGRCKFCHLGPDYKPLFDTEYCKVYIFPLQDGYALMVNSKRKEDQYTKSKAVNARWIKSCPICGRPLRGKEWNNR